MEKINKPLNYSDLSIDMKVCDDDGNIGTIKECKYLHNELVEYLDGGTGLYCLDLTCSGYDPLYNYN